MMQFITIPFKVIINGRTGHSFNQNEALGKGILFSIYIHHLCRISWQIYSFHVHSENTGLVLNQLKTVLTSLIGCLHVTSLFFVRKLRQQRNIRHILDYYCKAIGELVNLYKSKIQFSKELNNRHKKEIEQILQMSFSCSIKTYLGCSKQREKKEEEQKEIFFNIKHRMTQKLAGMKGRTLSGARKVVPIKPI